MRDILAGVGAFLLAIAGLLTLILLFMLAVRSIFGIAPQ
jgi:hypothetical protein